VLRLLMVVSGRESYVDNRGIVEAAVVAALSLRSKKKDRTMT
jgi:hypothetical protein